MKIWNRITNCIPLRSNLKYPLIWLFNLKNIGDNEQAYFKQCLDAQENQHAAHFRFKQDRKRFIVCRALVKIVLSSYCKQPPEAIGFTYNPYQRPYLHNYPDIDFNIAHTKDWGIFSIYRGKGRIGIDIEAMRPIDAIENLMEQFTSPFEQGWVLESESLKRFYLLWSAKESLLKAMGTGFAVSKIPSFERITYASKNVIVFQTVFSKTLTSSWEGHSIALSILKYRNS